MNLSADYLCWDNTESVTLLSTRKTGSMVDTLPPNVRRRVLSKKEQAISGGAFVGSDVVFLVPAPILQNGFVPKPGDQVQTLDGTVYTTLAADGQRLDSTGYQTWKLVTRNLSIAYDLQDVINIERPNITWDASGAKVKTFPSDQPPGGFVAYNQLPCRVQLLDETVEEVLGIRGFTGNYAVIVSQQVVITAEDRIQWFNPDLGRYSYLIIRKYHDAQRIDTLPVIDAYLPPLRNV